MEKPVNVCVLVGSLRKASYNGMLANAMMSLAPFSTKLETVEIGQLPLYNEDLEAGAPPPQWAAFRQRIKVADAVLFVTPEYNRSIPAALKNALMSDPGRMEAAVFGTASLVQSSGAREVRSGPLAPIIICAGHAAAGSLCRPCRQALR
jgi:NAD(P)H-dependent FMN reductase